MLHRALAASMALWLCSGCSGSGSPAASDQAGLSSLGEASVFEASIQDLHDGIRSSSLTCVEIVEQHLDRIHRYDLDVSRGAPINALVRVNPHAREIARDLDDLFSRTGTLQGPLHCVPLILKDNYDTFDMPTTAGSLALVDPDTGEEQQPPDDAFQVARYREAGAVILGHGTMDELATGTQGKSSRSGRTGNAYDTERNPGGSSGGPAAAVAAGFAVLGTGSDTCSSNRKPVGFHNLVSFRQSAGLASQDGVYPLLLPNDVEGPMARNIEDLAVMLNVIAVRDPGDPKTLDPEWSRPPDYRAFLDPNGLVGKRIGVLRSYAGTNTTEGADAHTLSVYEAVFDEMRAAGAEVIDGIELDSFDTLQVVTNWAGDVNTYLGAIPHRLPRDFAAVCASERSIDGPLGGDPLRTLPVVADLSPYRELDCEGFQAATSQEGLPTHDADVKRIASNRAYVESVLETNDLDGLVYPTVPSGPPLFAGENGKGNTGANCVVSANSGLPAIVIRGGFSDDDPALPIGMQILGRKFDEATLLEMAYAWETLRPRRQPPVLHSAHAVGPFPPLDIAAFNRLKLEIGEVAFPVMFNGGMPDGALLTAARFREIVHAEIERSDMTHLLP